MADYEFLEQGGHARLVSDTKGYVDRAGGVGTSQLADESVTMDKLADDVDDELDAIASDGAEFEGNVLKGELAEASVLTTDDAYAAPPMGVEVYGASTQVQTTGKNLLSDRAEDWSNTATIGGSNRRYILISVASGESCTYSRAVDSTPNMTAAWCDDSELTGYVEIDALTTHPTFTMTNSDGHAYLVISCIATTTAQQIANANSSYSRMIERGTTATTYEPYSGGATSPRPDWTQSIYSVDDLTLEVAGFNLFDEQLELGKLSTSTGADESSTTNLRSANAVPVKPLATYYFHVGYAGVVDGYAIGCYYDANGDFLAYRNLKSNATFIVPANSAWLRFFLSTNYGTTYRSDICISPDGADNGTYKPFVGYVQIPLSDHIARSLPDGTRDTLTLSYIGPSTEHEGWGVFGAELVQKVGELVVDGSESWPFGSVTCDGALATTRYHWFAEFASFGLLDTRTLMSNKFPYERGLIWSTPDNYVDTFRTYSRQLLFCISNERLGITSESTPDERTAAFKVWLAQNPVTVIYPLATPITHDLGEVELPILPNPLTAWADGGSAQPTMALSYERDKTIVINALEAAIADLATS